MDTMSSPRRRRKLPARAAAIVMPLILSGLMTLIVSAIATWRSLGLAPNFPLIWMEAWALSWIVAFPVLLAVLPVVRRLVALICEPAPR